MVIAEKFYQGSVYCFKMMSKIILDTWFIKKFSFASFSYKDDVLRMTFAQTCTYLCSMRFKKNLRKIDTADVV